MTQTLLKNGTKRDQSNSFTAGEGEEQIFLEEMGTLVFQSALMQQLTDFSPEEAENFEGFVNLNIGKETFLEALCKEYPDFEKLLIAEMTALNTEMKEIVK